MKRFALFAYDTYYPTGGWNDFVDWFESVEAAVEAVNQEKPPAPRWRSEWPDNKMLIDLLNGEDVTPCDW